MKQWLSFRESTLAYHSGTPLLPYFSHLHSDGTVPCEIRCLVGQVASLSSVKEVSSHVNKLRIMGGGLLGIFTDNNAAPQYQLLNGFVESIVERAQ